ncbi:MAG: aminoacyl-tRNA hydrolase [Firmicutes bacterium]|nr:aminoacyl-tRNA hydrolase [Candidatus Fiminaster equi]
MKLIVGLGNPGKEYAMTRHNCGFRVVDAFADATSVDIDKEDFHGVYGRFKFEDEDIILFKPLTMMNGSGLAVYEIVKFFKIHREDILIVYDDMAIEPGNLRLRASGSSGGQKGMENIIKYLSTENIKRIRVGIGEPKYDPIKHVLGEPRGEEKEKIDSAIERATKAIREFLINDFQNAMSKFNGGGNS